MRFVQQLFLQKQHQPPPDQLSPVALADTADEASGLEDTGRIGERSGFAGDRSDAPEDEEREDRQEGDEPEQRDEPPLLPDILSDEERPLKFVQHLVMQKQSQPPPPLSPNALADDAVNERSERTNDREDSPQRDTAEAAMSLDDLMLRKEAILKAKAELEGVEDICGLLSGTGASPSPATLPQIGDKYIAKEAAEKFQVEDDFRYEEINIAVNHSNKGDNHYDMRSVISGLTDAPTVTERMQQAAAAAAAATATATASSDSKKAKRKEEAAVISPKSSASATGSRSGKSSSSKKQKLYQEAVKSAKSLVTAVNNSRSKKKQKRTPHHYIDSSAASISIHTTLDVKKARLILN